MPHNRSKGLHLEPVLKTFKILNEEGTWLEITNLIVPNWTDNLDMIKKKCDWLYNNGFEKTPLHFSLFYPHYKLTDTIPAPIEKLLKVKEIAMKGGINFVYLGNVPKTGNSVTYYPGCISVLVERHGLSNK